MDDKDKTLYAEENRQTLIEINKGIKNLYIIINTQISNYKAPSDKMNVIGEVKVNTEKSVEISNLQSLSNDLKEFSQLVTQQTETIVAGIPQNVSINNLDDIKLESIKVSNINDIKEYFVILGKQIADNRPIVEVTQKELKLSTSPKDPIAVRLSDGKSFYNAIATAMSGGISTAGLATTAKQDNIITAIGTLQTNALTDTELRATPVPTSINNTLVPEQHDEIQATYPTTSSEVYTYKLSGVSVAVVTVTYADATKEALTSVVRS